MLRSQKEEFVSFLEGVYKDYSTVIFTHYHGLTVSQISSLRKSLRTGEAKFKVVKNTLSRIAATKSGLDEEVKGELKGPIAIAYSNDPVGVSKSLVEFAKSNESLKIVAGILDGKLLKVEEVKSISQLPSMDEIRGQIVGILQAPATKLVRIFQAPASQIARVIGAYAEKSN